jgi:hypothetical protein
MSESIDDGQTITQDSNDSAVRVFDWDDFLATGVTITGTPVFTVTKLEPAIGSAVTTVDNASVLSDGRSVQFRVVAGGAAALGHLYEIACRITTDETPAQVRERSFNVRVVQR